MPKCNVMYKWSTVNNRVERKTYRGFLQPLMGVFIDVNSKTLSSNR